MSRAQVVKAANRREVTLTNGHIYMIRKLTNRDYLEEGVLRILMDATRGPEERAAAIRDFYQSHESNVLAIEDSNLRKAVIDPPITDDGAGDSITLADLADDRIPLLNAIAEFSGFGASKEAESKKSGDAELAGTERPPDGPDGGVVRENAG